MWPPKLLGADVEAIIVKLGNIVPIIGGAVTAAFAVFVTFHDKIASWHRHSYEIIGLTEDVVIPDSAKHITCASKSRTVKRLSKDGHVFWVNVRPTHYPNCDVVVTCDPKQAAKEGFIHERTLSHYIEHLQGGDI